MSTTDTTPGKRDDRLIAALARGRTHEQAADDAGVSVRTVSRRLTDPTFKLWVHEARRELLTVATSRLCDAAGDAIDVLRALINDSESEHVKLGAARSLLQLLLPLREQLDLEERILALEQRA